MRHRNGTRPLPRVKVNILHPGPDAPGPALKGEVHGVVPKDYDDWYRCKQCGFAGCRAAQVTVSDLGNGNTVTTGTWTRADGTTGYYGQPTVSSGCPRCGSHNSR